MSRNLAELIVNLCRHLLTPFCSEERDRCSWVGTMKTFLVGLLIAAVSFSPLAFTYQTHAKGERVNPPKISIDNLELVLGMRKADVVKVIPEGQEIRQSETKGIDWLIAEKDHPNGPFVALTFANGKLTTVSRPWLDDSARASAGGVEVGRSIYGILSTFVDHGQTNCVLRLGRTVQTCSTHSTCKSGRVAIQLG